MWKLADQSAAGSSVAREGSSFIEGGQRVVRARLILWTSIPSRWACSLCVDTALLHRAGLPAWATIVVAAFATTPRNLLFLEHLPDGGSKWDRNCCDADARGKCGGSAKQIWDLNPLWAEKRVYLIVKLSSDIYTFHRGRIFGRESGLTQTVSTRYLCQRVLIVIKQRNKLSPEHMDIFVSLRINKWNNVNTINIGWLEYM